MAAVPSTIAVCGGNEVQSSPVSSVISLDLESEQSSDKVQKETWGIVAIMQGWNAGRQLKKVLAGKKLM